MNQYLFFVLITLCASAKNFTKKHAKAHTTMITEDVKPGARIDYKILKTPHHLLVGRCYSHYPVLHQEKIIFNNDGKSHISATIRVNIDESVYITCAKILDETTDGQNGYPIYQSGGVGHNFLEFLIMTDYGKGFDFYVQIFGYSSEEEYKTLNEKIP